MVFEIEEAHSKLCINSLKFSNYELGHKKYQKYSILILNVIELQMKIDSKEEIF